ncbi:MAG: hypothetical protein EXS67_00430 [Candidatus Margulisbacteria bacterium]|nr:hypothetical protein [Candidatus Margulisiibacteriota bacterium]
MKKNLILAGLLLTSTLIAPVLAHDGIDHAMTGTGNKAVAREARLQNHMPRLQESLGFSEDQMEAAKRIQVETRIQLLELNVSTDNSKEANQKKKEGMRAILKTSHDKMDAILTPEQREKQKAMIALQAAKLRASKKAVDTPSPEPAKSNN